MAHFGANLDLIPMYLEAKTREELMRLMWANNYANHMKFNYMEPRLENKKYIVWFYADLKDYRPPEPMTDEELKTVTEVK